MPISCHLGSNIDVLAYKVQQNAYVLSTTARHKLLRIREAHYKLETILGYSAGYFR